MDLSITAQTVNIEASSPRLVLANISGVTETELFGHFNIQQFIDHYGLVTVLDHIGSDTVKNHFDLTEIDK